MKIKGYEIVYEKIYGYLTKTSEIYNIRSTCASSTILCLGYGYGPSDLLNLVACGNCKKITTPGNTTTNSMGIFGGDDTVISGFTEWRFDPNNTFLFYPNYFYNLPPNTHESYMSVPFIRDDNTNVDSPWTWFYSNNTIFRKYMFKKEISTILCSSNCMIGFPVTCKLDLVLNGLAEFNVTIDYGDNQTASFTSASRTFNITKTYQNVGEYLIRVEIPSASIELHKILEISNCN
jgi:hypothetical protein